MTTTATATTYKITKDFIPNTGPGGYGYRVVGIHAADCKGLRDYRVGKVSSTHETLADALAAHHGPVCFACFGGKQVEIGRRATITLSPLRDGDRITYMVELHGFDNERGSSKTFADYDEARAFANAEYRTRNTNRKAA